MADAARLEPVIGLEIHVQLATRTKLFCGNAAEYGAAPNTHVCPVCLGLPGALPVLNRAAVELAVRAALGLGCRVHARSRFDRKHYLYPDLPRGYQITQHAQPLATQGALEVAAAEGGSRRVRIRRVHLEEDTGKSLHDRDAGATAIDLNRAGVPLIEIVTEPELASAAEARLFLGELKRTLRYLEVSDCNMEEGSLRVDANVSLRATGGAPGSRTELKNLNSFSQVERALDFEIRRQAEVLGSGGRVVSATLHWDAARGEARPMRSKEELHDYRYFPEPDLPPLELEPEWLAAARASLPELPGARRARLRVEHGLAREHAEALTATRELGDYYEAVVRTGAEPRAAATWVLGEVLAAVNETGRTPGELGVPPERLAGLLGLLADGALSRPIARRVFARMLETGAAPADIVAAERLRPVRDADRLDVWVDEVLAESPAEVERFRSGEARLLSFFVGQVMRRSGGRADPARVNEALRRRLAR